MKHLLFLLLITICHTILVSSSCFGNSSTSNTTTSPCLAGAYHPHQHPYRPPAPYPHVYPPLEIPGYRPSSNPYPQPGYHQQAFHGSHVQFPQSTGQHDPYYRPIDFSRVGYSYPSGYTGPHPDWNSHYNNHLSQPPPRYTIGYGHPNLSPVPPRRTYLVDQRQTPSKEPIFMDRGTISFVGRDVELSCAFYDTRYQIVSNVAWVKVTGPYEHGSLHPPFQCHHPGCSYLYINDFSDFRFRVITLGQTSTLRIYDYIPTDQGIYRCAATAQGPDGLPVTVYKIIEFFTHILPHRTQYQGK